MIRRTEWVRPVAGFLSVLFSLTQLTPLTYAHELTGLMETPLERINPATTQQMNANPDFGRHLPLQKNIHETREAAKNELPFLEQIPKPIETEDLLATFDVDPEVVALELKEALESLKGSGTLTSYAVEVKENRLIVTYGYRGPVNVETAGKVGWAVHDAIDAVRETVQPITARRAGHRARDVDEAFFREYVTRFKTTDLGGLQRHELVEDLREARGVVTLPGYSEVEAALDVGQIPGPLLGVNTRVGVTVDLSDSLVPLVVRLVDMQSATRFPANRQELARGHQSVAVWTIDERNAQGTVTARVILIPKARYDRGGPAFLQAIGHELWETVRGALHREAVLAERAYDAGGSGLVTEFETVEDGRRTTLRFERRDAPTARMMEDVRDAWDQRDYDYPVGLLRNYSAVLSEEYAEQPEELQAWLRSADYTTAVAVAERLRQAVDALFRVAAFEGTLDWKALSEAVDRLHDRHVMRWWDEFLERMAAEEDEPDALNVSSAIQAAQPHTAPPAQGAVVPPETLPHEPTVSGGVFQTLRGANAELMVELGKLFASSLRRDLDPVEAHLVDQQGEWLIPFTQPISRETLGAVIAGARRVTGRIAFGDSQPARLLTRLRDDYVTPMIPPFPVEAMTIEEAVGTDAVPQHLGRLLKQIRRLRRQLEVFSNLQQFMTDGSLDLTRLEAALNLDRFTPKAPDGAPPLVIGGNWKDQIIGTDGQSALEQAKALARGIVARVEARELPDNTVVFIAVSPDHLESVGRIVKGSRVKLAAQGVKWEDDKTPQTGMTPISHLLAHGVEYVIVGHSERRALGETDEQVNRQYHRVLEAGLKPVLAFGETLPEREAGPDVWQARLHHQLAIGLSGVSANQIGILAYEPVWAINTGRTATTEEANAAEDFVTQVLLSLYPDHPELVLQRSKQYGGSVRPGNAQELAAQPRVDGFLVGGASLNAESFSQVITNALAGYLARGTPPPVNPPQWGVIPGYVTGQQTDLGDGYVTHVFDARHHEQLAHRFGLRQPSEGDRYLVLTKDRRSVALLRQQPAHYKLWTVPYATLNLERAEDRAVYYTSLLEYVHRRVHQDRTHHPQEAGRLVEWSDAREDLLTPWLVGSGRYVSSEGNPYRWEQVFAAGALAGTRQMLGAESPLFRLIYQPSTASAAQRPTVLTRKPFHDPLTAERRISYLVTRGPVSAHVGTGLIGFQNLRTALSLGFRAVGSNRSPGDNALMALRTGADLYLLEEGLAADYQQDGIPYAGTLRGLMLGQGVDLVVDGLDSRTPIPVPLEDQEGSLPGQRLVEEISPSELWRRRLLGEAAQRGIPVNYQGGSDIGESDIVSVDLSSGAKTHVEHRSETPRRWRWNSPILLQMLGLPFDAAHGRDREQHVFSCNGTSEIGLFGALAPIKDQIETINIVLDTTRRSVDDPEFRAVTDTKPGTPREHHIGADLLEYLEQLGLDVPPELRHLVHFQFAQRQEASGGTRPALLTVERPGQQNRYHMVAATFRVRMKTGTYLNARDYRRLAQSVPTLAVVHLPGMVVVKKEEDGVTRGVELSWSRVNRLAIHIIRTLGVAEPAITPIVVEDLPDGEGFTVGALTFQEHNVVPMNLWLMLLEAGLIAGDVDGVREAGRLAMEITGMDTLKATLEIGPLGDPEVQQMLLSRPERLVSMGVPPGRLPRASSPDEAIRRIQAQREQPRSPPHAPRHSAISWINLIAAVVLVPLATWLLTPEIAGWLNVHVDPESLTTLAKIMKIVEDTFMSLLFAMLIHEIGHVVGARLSGTPLGEIEPTLTPGILGGVTVGSHGRSGILASLVGLGLPFASVLVFGVSNNLPGLVALATANLIFSFSLLDWADVLVQHRIRRAAHRGLSIVQPMVIPIEEEEGL
jgi:triosephosphate isomerase